ncbi:MAG TPA: hypothetical protein VMT85_11325 [Thermoanaerobaculia bacterium]|nr:hypothetical protein [Thermoanaerobaculia bacterium]
MSEQEFLDALPLLDRVVSFTCRRNGLFGAEAEEFESWVKLRIIESNYAVFARFEGRGSLQSYLAIVVLNLFRDYRISKWGKWRPSAMAKRLGTFAIQLESLISRDGLTVQEAVATVGSASADAPSGRELEELAAKLPVRVRRRELGEEGLDRTVATGSAEERTRSGELDAAARRVSEALERSVAALETQDRLILRLRFQEGLKIVDVARALGLDAKRLYPRIQGILVGVRADLQEAGVTWPQVAELLEWSGLDLTTPFEGAGGTRGDVSVSS